MSDYRFPAEWEHQEGVLLCFPHNGNDWPGKYEAVKWDFVEFIKKVARVEIVFLVVIDAAFEARVNEWLSIADVNLKNIRYIHQKTNRSWMRDSGPIIVKKGKQRVALNFNFNGWAKYSNYRLDKHVPSGIADILGLPLETVHYRNKPFVLEGGAIDSNGKGTLLTSEECLLHPKIQVRNSGFNREMYEEVFEHYLGIRQVIWLGDGIEGDDTHGHIDDLCRFVNENTIVTVVEKSTKDRNHAPLKDNLARLRKARLADGKQPDIAELPMPNKLIFDGLRLPASYANFLIINSTVLVPVFNDPNDRLALDTLSVCFPKREIIPISAINLIWGFGTLHCLSQQIPAK
ncbi:agmatine deiminase family protein [Fulvivirga sedimenti]|uniref:Agmatine deiminase family protein n=1 Tax=Fulvivirga sedimenti TaxID=2879465 RepID=A0A9X1HW19_9BACT|nr:agmatine deiminase family protein [Fulvivirga sedimenti]MCA6078906.1 agmatine deiminase family protein [Fulvivirga sedimenti]